MYGAPRKMKRKHGRNVTYVVTRRSDQRADGRRQPFGMIPRRHVPDELQDHDERSGRRLREREAIHRLACVSHPYDLTADCVTYASTEYAPPKVTSAACVK